MKVTVNYAGRHLIADMWGIAPHTMPWVEDVMKEGAVYAGATVLNSTFHHFGNGYGFTGVVSLAESHMSIHTWPERDFVALDIFMCGECDPKKAFEYIESHLQPRKLVLAVHKRGVDV